jgi:hypothetical protein
MTTTQVRSAEELVRRAVTDPEVLARLQADPAAELQRLSAEVVKAVPPSPPLESDVLIYRMAVGTIGLVALIGVTGAVIVSATKGAFAVPDILTAISAGAIGSLAGLLSPISFRR